jgi:YVTN family beta-propeller protein
MIKYKKMRYIMKSSLKSFVNRGHFLVIISLCLIVLGQDVLAQNQSALFDGRGSRIRIRDVDPANPAADTSAYQISGTEVTVEAWVYPMAFPTGEKYVIAARPILPSEDPFQSYGLYIQNGIPSFAISTGIPGSEVEVVASGPLTNFQWSHIAGTYDGSGLTIFVNGLFSDSIGTNIALSSSGVGFYVGRYLGSAFMGLIDEVRLWNINRFDSIEVAMERILDGDEFGLAGYWRMDEANDVDGRLVTPDQTDNHNDLLIGGNVDFVGFDPLTTYEAVPQISIGTVSVDFGVLEQYSETSQASINITNVGGSPLVGYFADDEDVFNGFGTFFYPAVAGSPSLISITANSAGPLTGDIEIYSNDPVSPSSSVIAIAEVLPNHTFDANNISMYARRDGENARGPDQNAGFEWPQGSSKYAIYSTGLWLGAQVAGETRVAVIQYNSEFNPGPIIGGVAADPNNSDYRMYKIFSTSGPGDPDYDEWPGDLGAPLNANGTPKLLGDQTLFAVYNDYEPSGHYIFGTQPLGAEVREIIYGSADIGVMNDAVFLRYKIINKSAVTWENAYISLWADADLGEYRDDVVGVDTARNMGYIYNGDNFDEENPPNLGYGATPPALGMKLIEGVRADDPLEAFSYYMTGGEYPVNDPQDATEAYNFMQGLRADGTPFFDPIANQTTKFPFSGDPVSSTGWYDEQPQDHRLMISAGPFNLSPGDSTDFTAVLLMAQGTDRLNSVTALRAASDELDGLYGPFVVNSTDDLPDENPGDGVAEDINGNTTLRAAIMEANARPGVDSIWFDISSAGDPVVIQSTSPLPIIDDAVVINGYTQSGASVATNSTPAVIKIILDGSSAGPGNGIHILSGNCEVHGLVINNFNGDGIHIESGGNNTISGNYIGTNSNGDVKASNLFRGLSIINSSENLIGGITPAARNIVSGNARVGILIEGVDARNNVISGNYVGLNAAGTDTLSNSNAGIVIVAPENTVGGVMPGARNIIAGNRGSGVALYSAQSINNRVIGNFIGTDVSGQNALGNLRGVNLLNCSKSYIGGFNSNERNIISGNERHGVRLAEGAFENFVTGNYIGTDVNGQAALANGYLHPDSLGTGVFLYGTPNNRIENNIISANQSRGITIIRAESYGNLIKNNKIGTDNTGHNPLPNTVNGIEIDRPINQPEQGPGSSTKIMENIIAFNGLNGIAVDAGKFNHIFANSIFSNAALGIDLGGDGVTANDVADPDTGGNNLQNYPVLDSVQFNAGQVIIDGTINSKPQADYELQFFTSQVSDPSGYGEGEHFLGSDTVTIDESGTADFTVSFPFAIFDGQAITALASNLDSLGTSEFSVAIGATERQIIAQSDFPLHYVINGLGEPTVTDGSDFTAIHNAFDTWTQLNRSTVDFVFDSTTSARYASATDGLNLVTFSDDQFPFPPGVLAIAAKTLDVSAGEENARIIDADVVFNYNWVQNANLQFRTETRSGNFDIQGIATHEIGHVFGLLHSGVEKATMFFVLQPGTDARSLETDDIAWASYLYPDANYFTNFGEIAGHVEDGYNPGFPVAGALLLAIHTTSEDSVHAYSDANGNFILPGLRSGDYTLSLQPLDGSVHGYPMTPANISPYVYAITTITDYTHEFYDDEEGNQDNPELFTAVPVSTGNQTTGINLITNVDLTPPVIEEVFPADGADSIEVNTEIVTTFSEPIDPTSFESAFSLIGTNAINGSFLYLQENRVAVFTPDQQLTHTTTYNLTIETSLADERGNPLQTQFSASFATGAPDGFPPEFLQIDPVDGQDSVFITQQLTLIFSEPIDKNSLTVSDGITAGSFTLETEGQPVTGAFTFAQQQAVAVFTPTLSLAEGKTYTITLSNDITDLSNNALNNPTTVSFSTVQQAPPIIVDYGPINGADQVSITTPVWAGFTEPIDTTTVSPTSFQLLDGVNPVTGSFEFIENQSVVVFRPTNTLSFSKVYTFNVTTDITDLSGVHMEQLFTVQFTTADVPVGPTIWSITPSAALIGNEVVIAGQGFDPVKTNNEVKFNNLPPASVSDASFYSLTVVVPEDATTGVVTVTVGTETSNPDSFEVLTAIDDPTNVVRTSVDTDPDSRDADITPDGAYAYVTHSGANSVSVINLETALVEGSIQVGSAPQKISINPTGTRAYVTNLYDNTISVIDIDSNSPSYNTEIRTITVGLNPIGVAVTPDGSRVYVANFTSQDIMEIDADPNSGAYNYVRSSVDTDSENRDIEVSPDGTLAFVTGSTGLIILNIDLNAPAGLFNSVVSRVDTDSETREVDVTPDGTLAVVTTMDGDLLFIDVFPSSPSFGQVRSSVDTETDSRDVEVSPDGTLLYVTNFGSNTVSVYEINYIFGTAFMGVIANAAGNEYDHVVGAEIALKLVQTIQVGAAPEGIVIDAAGKKAVVAISGDGGKATIIDVSSAARPEPTEAVTSLIGDIEQLRDDEILSDGEAISLLAKLNAAKNQLEKGNVKSAVNTLNAFIKLVQTFIDRDDISYEDGQPLIEEAKAIIEDLTKPNPEQRFEQLRQPMDLELPQEFGLEQNYPNPFNPITAIKYSIPGRVSGGVAVKISVFNLMGQLIATLVDGHKQPGHYIVSWNGQSSQGTKLASGIYIYRIETGEFQQIRKMILLK